MKIFITGASGFIGNHLCTKLLDSSYEVLAPIRNQKTFKNKIYKNLKFIKEDNFEFTKDYLKSLENIDCLIHCAGRSHIMKEADRNSLNMYRKVNLEKTSILAEMAAKMGVKRFIFLSSIKVNGELTKENESFKFDDKVNPLDFYSISKFEAEEALKEISQKTGLEVVILRLPLVYGPGVKGNFLRLLNLINRGIPLPFDKINNSRSLVGLSNLLDLISHCINNPNAAGNTFLVSDDEDISTNNLINKISYAMGKPSKLFFFPKTLFIFVSKLIGKSLEAERLVGSLKLDISHTKKILNWKPSFTIDSEIEKTVNWYLKNK